GVHDVDEVVGGEVRIDGDPDQAALLLGDGRDREGRGAEQRAVLDDADVAALLEDEEAAVGGGGQGRRRGEPGGDRRLREPGRQLHATGRVVIDDGERHRRGAAQRRTARRGAQRQGQRLVALHRDIFQGRDGECLARLAVGEGERARRGGVVTAGRGRAVAGRVVDAHRAAGAARPRDRDGQRPAALAQAVGGGVELERARLGG